MVRSLALLMILAGTLPQVASAEIYRWVDDKGVVHYSDKPGEDAKTVDLPEPTVVPATQPKKPVSNSVAIEPATQGPETGGEASVQGYKRVKLISPSPDETYQQGIPQIRVAVELDPPLQVNAGHSLRVLIDGSVVKAGLSTSSTDMPSPPQGSHSVSVEVMQGSQVLATVGPQKIHVIPRNNVKSSTNAGRAPRANSAPIASPP